MKKNAYLFPLVGAGLAVVGIIIACLLFFSRSGGAFLTVLDGQGNVMIQASSNLDIYEDARWPYLDTALREAAQIVAEQNGISPEDGWNLLFAQGYTVSTCFDGAVFDALVEARTQWTVDAPCALVVTDLKGSLLAVYCDSPDGEPANYALASLSPYSALKPLSVYTPAVEAGLIRWTTRYEDSAYKQLPDSNGKLQDWPANSTGTYSRKPETVYDGLRKSINTVAVKCLADLGVNNAIAFLSDAFDLPLEPEKRLAQTYGEEEIIGNIAMGYLETGVSPVDMAGYYQIFATGGSYTRPGAVTRLCTADGETVYQRQAEARQVVSPATADLMNKLLQGVLESGGTGTQARCGNIPVAGKTGTGDDFSGNWFVGVTPGFSCAVWHGASRSNQASSLFSLAMKGIYTAVPDARKTFITHQTLFPLVYCAESGMGICQGCQVIEQGYFTDATPLAPCDIHKK